MVLAICLDVWVVTIGKAIGLANLVVNGLDIKAGHLEAASKVLNLLLQLWHSGISVERPAKPERKLNSAPDGFKRHDSAMLCLQLETGSGSSGICFAAVHDSTTC